MHLHPENQAGHGRGALKQVPEQQKVKRGGTTEIRNQIHGRGFSCAPTIVR